MNSLAHVSSPPAIPLSNLSPAKDLYSKEGSCCFRLVVSEAIPLPPCLLGVLTPQSELAHWEATFSCSSSAHHWVMALRIKSMSTQDDMHQQHKSLADSKEMLRCLEPFFFLMIRANHIGGYLKKMGRNWPWEALKQGGGSLGRNNLPLVEVNASETCGQTCLGNQRVVFIWALPSALHSDLLSFRSD